MVSTQSEDDLLLRLEMAIEELKALAEQKRKEGRKKQRNRKKLIQ